MIQTNPMSITRMVYFVNNTVNQSSSLKDYLQIRLRYIHSHEGTPNTVALDCSKASCNWYLFCSPQIVRDMNQSTSSCNLEASAVCVVGNGGQCGDRRQTRKRGEMKGRGSLLQRVTWTRKWRTSEGTGLKKKKSWCLWKNFESVMCVVEGEREESTKGKRVRGAVRT